MARETAIRSVATTSALRLGERLRQLRVAAGLTQSELAGERFSKEYVSQIERGKTRPTTETIEWLAVRLGCPRLRHREPTPGEVLLRVRNRADQGSVPGRPERGAQDHHGDLRRSRGFDGAL